MWSLIVHKLLPTDPVEQWFSPHICQHLFHSLPGPFQSSSLFWECPPDSPKLSAVAALNLDEYKSGNVLSYKSDIVLIKHVILEDTEYYKW